jgi:hypothetical protein
MKTSGILRLLVSYLITPSLFVLSMITHGWILPTLNNHQSWTIEYIPMVGSSIIGLLFALKEYRLRAKKAWPAISFILNLLFCVVFIYTVYDLWGDNY